MAWWSQEEVKEGGWMYVCGLGGVVECGDVGVLCSFKNRPVDENEHLVGIQRDILAKNKI